MPRRGARTMIAPILVTLLAACGDGADIICVSTPSEGCAIAPLQPAVPETVASEQSKEAELGAGARIR
jgi:hypothetical protein